MARWPSSDAYEHLPNLKRVKVPLIERDWVVRRARRRGDAEGERYDLIALDRIMTENELLSSSPELGEGLTHPVSIRDNTIKEEDDRH